MIEKHYKSDFKVFVSLPDKLTLAPFKFTYFIEGNRTKYVVSYDGHSYYNCIPLEDGRLLIIFQNHNLGIGTINVIRQYFLPDEDYASGVCRTFSEESTDIYLGEGYYLTQAGEVANRIYVRALKGANIKEDDWREATEEEKREYEQLNEETDREIEQYEEPIA